MNTTPDTTLPTVGCTCSYVPEEILLAAHLRPRRLLPEAPPDDANAWLHPNTCLYLKSLFASARASQFADLSGVVIANSCDAARKLFDLWEHYVPDLPAHFLEIPKTDDPEAIAFFAAELTRFAQRLGSTIPGARQPTPESLHEAIRVCNAVREKMQQVFHLQQSARPLARGSDVFDLCRQGATLPPEAFIEKIDRFLAVVREDAPQAAKKRLVLSGCALHRPDLIRLIEHAGGRVTALDTCLGLRRFADPVVEGAPDATEAIARRYLTRPTCPRMEGVEQRLAFLGDLVQTTRAHGVIYSPVKFCDPFLYDAPVLFARFREAKIPFLMLEHDYEHATSGPVRTRVEAFVETIG